MIVLLVLGAFGVKAAIAVYCVYRFARWVTGKGDAIHAQYQETIRSMQRSIRILEEEKKRKERHVLQHVAFPQKEGRA